MIIDKKNIRTLSMLGERGAFGLSLLDVAKDNNKVMGLSADLCKTSGMDRFANEYPDRFLNVGIAEQNLVGISAGLADSGYIPYATTFTNFFSLRANEQMRHFLGYMNSNVKLVGFGAGFAMELFGNTHYGLEDISAIRAIPNLVILSPADSLEVYKCVLESSKILKPVYIRLTGKMNIPIIYKEDYNFAIGKNIELINGKDVAIFSTGTIVNLAISVANELEKNNISCSVINVHTLKPFDKENLKKYYKHKLLVSIEEHSMIGGLGSIIADYLSEDIDVPTLIKFGTQSEYKLPGDYDYMLSVHGLTIDIIVNKIIKKIKGDKNV